jgi:riboflavin synthase
VFTGLVQGTGMVRGAEWRGGDLRLVVEASVLSTPPALGDSIAVSGVCLTVVDIEGARLAFDLSRETIDRSTLGALRERDAVNLEAALRVGDALGGHMVSGHVDGIATVVAIEPDARAQRWRFALPRELMRFVAPKGSICLDGVSLTVNGVDDGGFDVAFIPHTLAVTTFGGRRVGDRINVEVDLVARYLDRLLAARGAQP